MIGTSPQKVANSLNRLCFCRVDDVGRPESSGGVEPRLLDVDHNDP